MRTPPVILVLASEVGTVLSIAAIAAKVIADSHVLQASSIRDAHEIGGQRYPHVVIFDHSLSDPLLDLVRDLKTSNPRVVLILLYQDRLPYAQEQILRLHSIHLLPKQLHQLQVGNMLRMLVQSDTEEMFSVSLRQLRLLDILQLKCMSGATCLLDIEDKGGSTGQVVLSQGHLLHAMTGDRQGVDAIYHMAGWRSGQIVEKDFPLNAATTIEKNWQEVLIESARLLDEEMIMPPQEEISPDEEKPPEPRVLGAEDLTQDADQDFLERRKILIVDDSPIVLRYLETMLGLSFPELALMTVENGQEGLRYAREYTPSLILLDFGLPDLNGDAFCAALSADPELAKVPVIVMSGLPVDFPRIKKINARVITALAKPFSIEQLNREIERTLDIPTTGTAAG